MLAKLGSRSLSLWRPATKAFSSAAPVGLSDVKDVLKTDVVVEFD